MESESEETAKNEPTPALEPQPLEPWFLKLLACPACPQRWPLQLNESKTALHCWCGRYAYPISPEGIPVLLVEEAILLDDQADPATVAPPQEGD